MKRREFMERSLAAAGAVALGGALPAVAKPGRPKTAVDRVPLGKTSRSHANRSACTKRTRAWFKLVLPFASAITCSSMSMPTTSSAPPSALA